MKKYIFIGIAIASMLCACSRDEESFFEQSAAERTQGALDNANAVLMGAPNGWDMIYFANTESRGFNLIVKFDPNGRVYATAKNSQTTGNKLLTDSTSTWAVKSDYGPILTFDTFNEVLHAWADPQGDGDGFLGDYEFLILRADSDRVVLKGKKHSAYTIMRPMPEMDANEYYAGCSKTLNDYFGNGNILTLHQDGERFYVHNGSTGIFNIVPYGEKAETEDPKMYPICATLDGFIMSYGFNKKNERLFLYEGDKFVGEEGSILDAGNLADLFVNYIEVNKGWTTNLTQSTGVFTEALAAFETQLKTVSKDNKAKVNSVAYTYSDTIFHYQGSHILRIKFEYKNGSQKTIITADYAIDVTKNDGRVTLTFNKPANASGETWYNQEQVSELKSLINAALGTFTFALDNPINPTKSMSMTNEGSTLMVSGSGNLK